MLFNGVVISSVPAMIAAIEEALNLVDVLITTGSVSMGDKDMLKPIIKEIFGATIHFGNYIFNFSSRSVYRLRNSTCGPSVYYRSCELETRKANDICHLRVSR